MRPVTTWMQSPRSRYIGLRQDDIGIPGNLAEIHFNGDDKVEFIEGLAGGGGIGDGHQGVEAVDDQSLDGIGVFIQDGWGQLLGVAVKGIDNGKPRRRPHRTGVG